MKNYIGWAGMAMLQFNSIPAILSAVNDGARFPIATILLTIAGLACYMVRAVIDKDTLYITGNLIGLVGNFILLFATLGLLF